MSEEQRRRDSIKCDIKGGREEDDAKEQIEQGGNGREEPSARHARSGTRLSAKGSQDKDAAHSRRLGSNCKNS